MSTATARRKRRSPEHARAIESAADELRNARAPSAVQKENDGSYGAARRGWRSGQSMTLSLAKLLLIPAVTATPLFHDYSNTFRTFEEEPPKSPNNPELWIYLGIAILLVLGGGVFAGLTIALMGQDETYLQVLATSGEGAERRNSTKVLELLKKGKHWVLVTLLLSNVITNETLPIVLDRSLGGGWPAVLSSTVLIVIFGEVAPQSVCVRYGLSIGARCAPFVQGLMWILAPVAWPTAKLLDYLLGEDHGTTYKKAGLKTLVQLHKTLGTTPGERLLEDEVNIIQSVLDLKDKPVSEVMTPMQDVFTMSADTVLDERMMDTILSQGYSRIPIYAPDNHRNFIGMLLVKILITYDPEDAQRVRDFALATLPETGPHVSCLDIINFFQEGRSHMVLVSDDPGSDHGAMGVVTLEDVIEELIGEEIVDESDVFVDVHKAIRRLTPAESKRYRMNKKNQLVEVDEGMAYESEREDGKAEESGENAPLLKTQSRQSSVAAANAGPGTTFLMRRKSSNASSDPAAAGGGSLRPVGVRSNTADLRQHLKHLGPSNLASKPRETKFKSVKIKPGIGTIPEGQATAPGAAPSAVSTPGAEHARSRSADIGRDDENAPLLANGGPAASDGVEALQQGYGTNGTSSSERPGEGRGRAVSESQMSAAKASAIAEENIAAPPQQQRPYTPSVIAHTPEPASPEQAREVRSRDSLQVPPKLVINPGGEDGDEVGEMEGPSRDRSKNRRTARSGSITETTVDVGGVKKIVLDTNSSSDQEDASPTETNAGVNSAANRSKASLLDGNNDDDDSPQSGNSSTANGSKGDKGKDKRKKRGSKKKKGGHVF